MAGDLIDVSFPAGGFVINTKTNNPVVFISGGVGQAPLISMAEHLINGSTGRMIHWIHGSRNKAVHAFDNLVTKMACRHASFKKYIFYDAVEDKTAGEPYYTGIVDLNKIRDEVVLTDADYCICGPAPFIKKQFDDLIELGIKQEAIHLEDFGSGIFNKVEAVTQHSV